MSTAELPSADEIVWAPSPTGDAKGNGDAKRPRAPRPEKEQAPPPRPLPGARTTRVVLRTLDPWSVLKLSLVFYLALFVVILVAGTLLWAGASAAGVVGNIEDFMVDIGFEDFRFIPSKLFAGVALGGLVLVVAGTCANVLMTALFNLMSDVVGGLKVTLQEDGRTPNAKDDGTATI